MSDLIGTIEPNTLNIVGVIEPKEINIIGEINGSGPAGETGLQGIQGITGGTGADSVVPGPQGIQGVKGDTGIQGIPGESFIVDATGLLVDKVIYDAELKGYSYLATDTGDIYIKNSDISGDWSLPIPFRGETGLTGLTGPVGETGIQGIQGIEGLSAYQVWINLGNIGTEAEYLLAIKGTQGIQGIKGDTGLQGIKGDIGLTGEQGIPGVDATLNGGTELGILVAQNNIAYTTKQVRNIIFSTVDADLGLMANGDIWIKYVV